MLLYFFVYSLAFSKRFAIMHPPFRHGGAGFPAPVFYWYFLQRFRSVIVNPFPYALPMISQWRFVLMDR